MGCDDQKQLVLNAQERYISTTNMMDMREKTEKFWREQIAQEIEDSLAKNIDIQPWVDVRNFRYCANIARGKNG